MVPYMGLKPVTAVLLVYVKIALLVPRPLAAFRVLPIPNCPSPLSTRLYCVPELSSVILVLWIIGPPNSIFGGLVVLFNPFCCASRPEQASMPSRDKFLPIVFTCLFDVFMG